MSSQSIRLTARQCVHHLDKREITPLDLIDAAERRIARCEPALNALPTSASTVRASTPVD